MADVALPIRGMSRLQSRIERTKPLFVGAVQRAVADTVLFAEVAIADQVDEMDAVDTGRMKASVSSRRARQSGDSATRILPGGLSAVVGTHLQYAIPVHEGYTRTLKGKTIRAAYGAHRGRFTQDRVRKAERSTRFQANLRISRASYSREAGSGAMTMHVEGRPFMRAAIPEIDQQFIESVREHVGRIL